MRTLGWITGCLVLASIAAATAHASERKINHDQLPAAVQAAADKEAQGATVKGFSTEVEGGKRVYEMETIVSGHTRDLQFTADGTLTEVEEEVALNSLPTTVHSALMAKAGSATIVKVESLTKQGKLVAYEAATEKGSKHGEIQVGPAGETLKHEE